MNYEEIYSKASKGDENTLKELIAYAEQGEAEAQYLLSCLYEMNGPLKDEEQADYWLNIAVFNGNEQAKQKYYSRPLKSIKNNPEEYNDSGEPSDEPKYNYVESVESGNNWNIRLIWWILFPFLMALYYMHKCEKDAEREKAFKELIKPMDQKIDNFNPTEHIQVNSDLSIKVDEEYVEHLKKKYNQNK